MTTRRLHGKVDSKCSCASDSDDIAIYAGLRHQKFKRRILGGPPSLVVFVSFEVDCKRIDASCGQLLRYILPRITCAVTLMKQQYARSRLHRHEVGYLYNRAV